MNKISTYEARNRLSQIINAAAEGEPQIITNNGVETVVVISIEEYKRLTAKRENLSDFLLNSPLRGAEIDLTRSKDTGRPTIDFTGDEYE